ncbi:hypothetical protein ABENE_18280 [Asticcacaulis benevestitus DSM 16100 = ATCC BAA-896]|uniref:Uncharacterized protein n=2 Tax=Asticcacaulis TaxID=76890 RepID=V4PM91_9CAUL|nr:hypothetical protein ABENE_18280 [Asticcacaulis benevestitus DSM 16100 = ATCC BAA-896]
MSSIMSLIRYATLSFAAALLLSAAPASAGLFGKDKSKEATTTGPTTNLKAASQTDTWKPASKADIESVLRADALTQSTFFTTQFEHDPTNVQIGLYLSNALRALGRYAEAADTAHRVLLFAPDNHDLLIAAGRAHIADNNAFFAIDPLEHAIELKPKDWQAYSLLGVAYDQTKRPEEAQTTWAKALALAPNNPMVLTNMAMSKVTRGDFAGAEPLLRTAVTQPGATLQVRQNLALVLGLQGKMPEAEQLLRRDMPPEQADAALAWLQQAITVHTAPVANPAPARSWDSVKASGS